MHRGGRKPGTFVDAGFQVRISIHYATVFLVPTSGALTHSVRKKNDKQVNNYFLFFVDVSKSSIFFLQFPTCFKVNRQHLFLYIFQRW